MNDKFFHDLELIRGNRDQFSAYSSQDNTVVIAGPGSGKTRVLALKAIRLMSSEICRPSGLAVISFSRETVRELTTRLRQYGFRPNETDFVGTVHSFSLLKIIQPFGHLYPQYGLQFPIKILPFDIARALYTKSLTEAGIKSEWDASFTNVNRHRSLDVSGISKIEIETDKVIAKVAKIYDAKILGSGYIDFTNIINIATKIVREQDFVRKSLGAKFPWLLVDEYQDLGKGLHEMVLELVFNAGIRLYAVGDVNQSIYGFNGGYPEFLNELSGFKEIDTIILSSNFRSSQHIIDASLEALQPGPPFPKYIAEARKNVLADFTFITCREGINDQFKIVAEQVIPRLQKRGVPLNEIGIIASSNAQIHEMATNLRENGLSCFIVNWRFENSAVAVWLQDCAKWCTHSHDQTFDEIFRFWRNLIHAHKDVRRLLEDSQLRTVFYEVLIESANEKNCFGWLNHIVSSLNLLKILGKSEIYPNENENIERILEEMKLHNLKDASISRFGNLGQPEQEVTITTRHSSKGLEFEVVIMLGMEEGFFPSQYIFDNKVALAEDQRLCYVCISRAKLACVLLRSEQYIFQGKQGPWSKKFPASRYWVSLHKKFGTNKNTFTAKEYLVQK